MLYKKNTYSTYSLTLQILLTLLLFRDGKSKRVSRVRALYQTGDKKTRQSYRTWGMYDVQKD